jgi:hypothetical protein
MKKIVASVLLTLFFLISASMVKAEVNVTDKTIIAAAKTNAQVKKLLDEGC